ncbi:MAG TPA: hypothetical protein VFU06_10475 [Longimicrobiales bacterium]|nr:hypothetical protein [Longimicrobiales bacterium]
MTYVFVRWQLARWLRAHPGRFGVIVIALLPLVFLVPFDRTPVFDNWRRGAAAAAFSIAVLLTAVGTRDSARVPAAAVWLFQKGIRTQDAFLTRWVIDMGFVLLVCLWSGVGIVAGSLLHDTLSPGWVLQVIAGAMLIALIGGALLFGTSAAGSDRGGDLLALLLFVSLLEPLGSLFLAPAGRAIAHVFLLPINDAAGLPGRLLDDPLSAVHAAFHVTAWCTVWLAFGAWRLAAWRPLPGAR